MLKNSCDYKRYTAYNQILIFNDKKKGLAMKYKIIRTSLLKVKILNRPYSMSKIM